MGIRKRTLLAWGMAVVAAALLAGVWGLRDTARPASAQADPAELFQQLIDALNRGDLDAIGDLTTDDFVGGHGAGILIGQDAHRNDVEHMIALHTRMTIISCEVSGGSAACSVEVEEDLHSVVGVERILLSCTVRVSGDKISGQQCVPDFTDPQTAQFTAFVGANMITFGLPPGRDADQPPGTAALKGFGDQTELTVTIPAGPAGVPQPAHIHEGTCDDLGGVAFPLQDVGGGKSWTILDVPRSDLQTGNFAVAVQRSHDEPDVYVACGDIPAAEAGEAPVIAPAPAADLPATGSGGFLDEESGGTAIWWYPLAAGAALLIIGGLAGLWSTRSRR